MSGEADVGEGLHIYLPRGAMKKINLYTCVATAGLLVASLSTQAMAQNRDNNFSRDRSTSVEERARPEFTPLGLRAGSFVVTPVIGVGLGYKDNVYYTDTNKKSDAFLELTPGVVLTSNWGRHSLSLGAKSTVVQYASETNENTAVLNLNAQGRLDISSAASLAGNLSHETGYESRASFLADPNARKPVKITTTRAGLDLTLVGNRVRFIGSLNTEDESYDDVASLLGGTIPQGYRDMTGTTVSGRIDYAMSPSVSFFVYGASNQRRYDISSINDSDGAIFSVGTSFEIRSLSRGEIQIGTLAQDYKNQSVGKLTNTYYNGKLEWFPTELSTVTAKIGRQYSDTPSVGGSVSALASTAGIAVDHELLRNLILSGDYEHASYEFNGIDRRDTRDTISFGARYLMNRRISLKANVGHQKYDSSGAQAFRNYSDNSVRVALVLQY